MTYRRCSLTEARIKFAQLIREVEAGNTIVITRRGTPIVILAPYVPERLPESPR